MTIMELESQDSPALATKAAHRDGYNFHPKRYQYISIPAHALEFFLPPPPPQIKTRKKKKKSPSCPNQASSAFPALGTLRQPTIASSPCSLPMVILASALLF